MAGAPKPTWFRRLLRWIIRATLLGGLAAVGGLVVAALAYDKHVVDEPGEHVSPVAIQAIIAQESPVLYGDGETRIGVFFSREHREYVPYSQIPGDWVDAIVAAEDQRYFQHPGVDVVGISRAMLANVKAGRVVAGGSSLTQQTAKNLYYRPDRSFRSKWEELVNALRLEAHYSKEDILEFYANQFHVSANGRGLGIAARYFFDKEVGELDTLECAFIAGMVKAPARYNPFTGKTEERRQAARDAAKVRTGYVLDRMLATGRLDAAEHARLKAADIPFKRGSFQYDTNVVIDEVALRLEQAPFPELFAELGIDNPSTAGIQVVTTLDADAQREATWALWHHLSEVGPLMEAQTLSAWFDASATPPRSDPDRPFLHHTFRRATVTAVHTEGDGAPRLELDASGRVCLVDEEALQRVATIVARAETGQKWRTAKAAQVLATASSIPVGAVVWASHREEGLCDLELRPELQGGVLLLEDGQIRAMVGGNDNRNFNRATAAKRQLGSTWKPLVYAAALQHGWAPTDPLDNRDNVFHFEGTWYYPRPDHKSEEVVSIAWAGTRSENLASIWLLVHLLDHLDAGEFRDAAAAADLVPRKGEGRQAWIGRVRDEYGVIAIRGRLDEVAWTAARQDLLGDLDPGSDAAFDLRSLSYGRGAQTEEARVVKGNSGSTRARKLRAVRANYLRYSALGEVCRPQAESLLALQEAGAARTERSWLPFLGDLMGPPAPEVPSVDEFAALRVRNTVAGLEVGCGEFDESWQPVSEMLLAGMATGLAPRAGPLAELRVERVDLGLLDELARATERHRLVLEPVDPYDFESLRYHPDFRLLVAMRTVSRLARELGVATELPPVMSMPLGAVDISLEEAASMYAGMLTGDRYVFGGMRTVASGVQGLRGTEPVPAPESNTLLIAEIRDRQGNVLYRATPEAVPVADPDAGRLTADILQNVVRWGTGRRANGTITWEGKPVPVAGKTGTTNSYKNAAFSGWIPRVHDGAWSAREGYALAVYVGYDDNRPMNRKGTRLQGASGALPVWMGVAQGLADHDLLGAAPPEDSTWALSDDMVAVPVRAGNGLPVLTLEETDGPVRTVLVRGNFDEDGVKPLRRIHILPPEHDLAEPSVARPPAAPNPVTELDGIDEVWIEEMEDPRIVPSEPPEAAPDGPGDDAEGGPSGDLIENLPADLLDGPPPDSGIVPRILPGD